MAPFISVHENNSEYVLWISIDKALTNLDENMILGSVYIPPENSRFFNEDLWNKFENELEQKCSQHKYVYIAGDTNCRIGTMRDFVLSDPYLNNIFDIDEEIQADIDRHRILENLSIRLERNSKDHRSNSHGMRLIEILRTNNLFILNGRLFDDKDIGQFTFRNKTVIDYVFATAECFQQINAFKIVESDSLFSDGHNALCWEISVPKKAYTSENSYMHFRTKPFWKTELSASFNANLDADVINNINCQLDQFPQSHHTIEQVTYEIQKLFQNAAEKTFPQCIEAQFTTSSINNKPWFGPKCHRARKNYHDAKSTYLSNPNTDTKLRFKHASKLYKRTMNFYIKKHKQNNATKLRELNDKNPKRYWKFLNSLKSNKKDNPSPNIHEFFEYFEKTNSNTIQDDRFEDYELRLSQEPNDFLDSPINSSEIYKCISNLHNSKAPHPTDKIINEYLKSTKDILLPTYCKLFNSVLETGHIPKVWLEGSIIPIYKNKGDSKDPANYRPITILSCFGKLFTSILNQRLTKFLEDNNLLDQNQAGFRKGYSCSDHIFTLHCLFEIVRKRKHKLFCGFVDFSQAFDKVWRIGLWHKLLNNSINGKFFNVINNMYKNIKSYISHNGQISDTFTSEIGLRQGENLSPVLFSMYLNDLQSCLHLNGAVGIELRHPLDFDIWLKLLVLLYADDTVILSDSAEDFQRSLSLFNDYCKNWHLQVNMRKTKIIIFGARQLNNFEFKFDDQIIEIIDQYHYLGVTFSSSGSFLKARKHVAEQATKAMHLLFTRANNSDLPIDLILKLFDHTVIPILTYGSEVFGYENIDILEKVHNNFLRKITKARRSTPMSFLYGELGRYRISIIVKTRMISFWNRLILSKEQKISLQIYKYMLNLPNSNFKWISKIKEILNSVGRPDMWENQFHLNQTNIHKQVKQTLIDQFKQQWHEQLQESNKGRIYNSFKEQFEFEPYFKTLSTQESMTIFQYRTANHRLPVETGRYDGTPFVDRVCTLCNMRNAQPVGCERHYLLECTFFSRERSEYLGSLNIRNHNLSLKTLLASTSLNVLKNVCKFVNIIMKKF